MSVSTGNGTWPDLAGLESEEGKLIRRALNWLGEHQLIALGSIEEVSQKVDDTRQNFDTVRSTIRTEIASLRQQFGAVGKTLESVDQRLGQIEVAASDAKTRFDSMGNLLKKLQVADRAVSSSSDRIETPSIPPPLTLGDRVDFKRTPMGGIKLDQRDQALLAQRMAKLEEDRRVADAVAADRAAIIAAQKKEAEEKRLADERKAEAARLAEEARVKLDLDKSKERRAWIAVYIGAATTFGGGVVWIFHALTHH
jgi:hypothetical protein